MKGKLKKIDDKWCVIRGDFKLPLHSNFITMTDYVWVRGIKVYDGDEVEFTEVFVNPMGRDVDPNDLGQNHSLCKWYARPHLLERGIIIPHKEEQKQHLIDMMKGDEELGLYEQIDQNNPVTKGSTALVKEIKLEDVFNDEKREGAKRVIHQHKVLKGLYLINPAHLEMTSDGYGEFPDGYKLTEKGVQYIIEQLNK
jgi:hypothetical protein